MRVGLRGYLNHEGLHFAGFMLEVLPDRILHLHKLNVKLFFIQRNRLHHLRKFDLNVFCVLTKLLVNYTLLLVYFGLKSYPNFIDDFLNFAYFSDCCPLATSDKLCVVSA